VPDLHAVARYGCSTNRDKQLPLSIEVQVFLYEEKVAIIALFGVNHIHVSVALTEVCTPCHPRPAWKKRGAGEKAESRGKS
jgi:hypothetical protein